MSTTSMTKRRVTSVRRDDDGDIVALCGTWGDVSQRVAARQILNKTHTYVVGTGVNEVKVHVLTALRTSADDSEENNLQSLPECDD